jgi:L,D-peptidoglycan transpeptidase YkuD (ErfK/YbiS/YcfS/YnhG family)
VPIRSGGVYQLYQGGAIYWSPATGAHTSRGAVRGEYAAKGWENGFLGYPTTDEVPIRSGGVYQLYQGGAILWSPATGAHTSGGAIRSGWAATGYENGPLGYPTTDEIALRGGVYQLYQGGAMYWSPGTGAHASRGGIRAVWAGTGYENGSLGYPVADELCSGSSCIQKFQGGTITWLAGVTGVHPYNECEALNTGRSKYPSYGASAVSFAIAESYGSYRATFVRCQNTAGVYWPDWSAGATVGRSGFKPPGVASGPTRYEYSPTGDYSVTQAFGLGNPGTALPYQTLNPNSRWGGNPWTATYNQYFESSNWVGYDENMWYFATRSTHDYRQGAVLNYNRPPDSRIVQDAGFAIFLHGNTSPTAGCIALPDWNLVNWLQKARGGDRIIMGVRSALFS